MFERSAAIDNANRLVGRFLQHFAALERAIDEALTALLSLDLGVAEVVLANMAFYNKVATLFAGEKQLAAAPDDLRREKLRSTRNRILQLNDERNIAAHSSFDAALNGTAVQFRRVVAKKELTITDTVWTEADVEAKCAEAALLAESVNTLVSEMKPFQPFADVSDPRNLALAFAIGVI